MPLTGIGESAAVDPVAALVSALSARARKTSVDVRDFGYVGDGVTDETTAINGALASLGGLAGEVVIPITGAAAIVSSPISVGLGQNLRGLGTAAAGTLSVCLKAAAGFTGDAIVQSHTWAAGGGIASSWHWASVENMRIDCNHIAAYGVAIYNAGETSVLRRLLVMNAADTGIIAAGAHAPFTIEHCNGSSATNYGLKIGAHPAGGAYVGQSGAVRVSGFSGDSNGVAHIYIDGAYAIDLSGWKSESHNIGMIVAGNTPQILATGYVNAITSGADVFKITGSATPRIASQVRANAYTNYLNDTVNSRTVAATGNLATPTLFTYGGSVLTAGQTARQRVTKTITNSAVNLDVSQGDVFEVTLTGNGTSCTLSNPIAGQQITLTFIQDGTGSRSYVWPTATYAGGAAPANIGTANRQDSVTLVYSGSAWYETSRSQNVTVSQVTPARSGRYLTSPSPVSQTSNGTQALNSLRYTPVFFDRAGTVTELGIYIPTGNTSATVRLGLYADADGQPTGAALVDAGTVDASTSGYKSVTGLSVAVNPGRYWVATVSQGAAATTVGVLGVAQGISLTSNYSGSDQTAWVDSQSTSGALPTVNASSFGRGSLTNVKLS